MYHESYMYLKRFLLANYNDFDIIRKVSIKYFNQQIFENLQTI